MRARSRAGRSGVARGRKRCGKSITDKAASAAVLGRTEGPTEVPLRGRGRGISGGVGARGRQAGGGPKGEVAGSLALGGPEPSGTEPGGAKRKSALGSAVHHFGCAEVIPCPSRRRRDDPLSE